MKTCTVQNPLSGSPRAVCWERLDLGRGRFQEAELEGLFRRDRAGLWFERRNFPLAARAAAEAERGGPMELSIALESLARGGLPFAEFERAADRALRAGGEPAAGLSLLLCSLLGWFEAREGEAGDAGAEAALDPLLRLLVRVGDALRPRRPASPPVPPGPGPSSGPHGPAGPAAPGEKAGRGAGMARGPASPPGTGPGKPTVAGGAAALADELVCRLHGLLARRHPEAYPARLAACRAELPPAWRTVPPPAGKGPAGPRGPSPQRYRAPVRGWFCLCLPQGGEIGEESDEFRLAAEALFQFDLFRAGVRDPDLSVFTDVAVILRDLYETLVNRRVKDDFLAFLEGSGQLKAFKAECAAFCRGPQRNLCQALSFVPNPERKLRPGEWADFLGDLQRLGEPGVSCPRARRFLDFLRQRHWEGLFLRSPRFAEEVRAVFRSGCLSRLVHHPRPGWDTYRELEGLFERLSGLGLDYWAADPHTREKQFDRSAVFPLLLEPRVANAMA